MLGFSRWGWQEGIARHGLEMTIDRLGTCFVIAWALHTQWRAPRILEPFLLLGRRSYEIYLTHMFIVFALLHIFLAAGKPMAGVPLYFAGTILLSAIMGEIVARFYSEPMNRRLRRRFGDGADRLGSVDRSAEKHLAGECGLRVACRRVRWYRRARFNHLAWRRSMKRSAIAILLFAFPLFVPVSSHAHRQPSLREATHRSRHASSVWRTSRRFASC